MVGYGAFEVQPTPHDIDKAVTDMFGAIKRESQDASYPGVDRRAEPRRASCVNCDLWVFDELGNRMKVANVTTRNSSFSGLSVVAKLSKLLQVGQPVEAVLAQPDGSQKHEAGIVAFCRCMEDGYYELGIQVKAVGSHAILTNDVDDQATCYAWFAEALQALKKQTGEQATG